MNTFLSTEVTFPPVDVSAVSLVVTNHGTAIDEIEVFNLSDPVPLRSKFSIGEDVNIPFRGHVVLPPGLQIANGVAAQDVTCKEGLEKYYKSNGSPICLKSSTAEKLSQRIGATDILNDVVPMRSGVVDATVVSTDTISGGKGFLGKIDVNAVDFDSDLGSPETDVPVRGLLPTNIDLALYSVLENQLVLNSTPDVEPALQSWQQDYDHHKQVWSIFAQLIPEEHNAVEKFSVFTDPIIINSAFVDREQSDIPKWEIWYDPIKFHTYGEFDSQWATIVMIHEYGHMFTHDPSQTFLRGETECEFIFNTYFGCLKEDSYEYSFVEKFWLDIESDRVSLTKTELYNKHSDRFVTEYSASNPSEDIAESWTAFVLRDKPTGNSIKDQKILFFYDFEELVALRDQIRLSSPFIEHVDENYVLNMYGDIQVTNYDDGSIQYTWHNGSSKIVWSTGIIQITMPNSYTMIQYPDGTIEWHMDDGRFIVERADGVLITEWPNGDKHIVYPDGTSEIW